MSEHERKKQDQGNENADDFGNKGQGHFLNLSQSLEYTDNQTDKQGNQQDRADNFYQGEDRSREMSKTSTSFMGSSYSSGSCFSK